MARISGSVSQRSDSYSFYIDWSESDVSVANNTSKVTATAYIYCSKHSASASNQLQKLVIDGTTFTATKNISLSSGVTVTLISGSKTITHNIDGSKSITISASCDLPDGSGWGPAWGSASGTATLTTIPRASKMTLSSSNFNIGSSITINTNRASSSFTHRLDILFNGTTVRTMTGIGASYTWNTTELYSIIPTLNKADGRMILTTYNGSTTIGTSYATFTANVVNSNPTFSNFEYEDIKNESLALTGNNQYLINNYNTLKVIISTSNKATPKNSATMSKYRLVCGNKSVEANYSSSENVEMTLENVTNMTFTVYAIDSRGNSTTITKSATEWKDYKYPVISSATATRTGGVSKETTLSFEGTLDTLNFGAESNTITSCQYKYKKSNEAQYSSPISITPTISNGQFSFNSTIVGDLGAEGFNLSNTFNIQIIVADKIKTVTYNVLLGSGSPAMAIHPDGVSIGEPYDENIGGKLQLDGAKIIESGSNSNGSYIKFSDGTMICYGKKSVTHAVSNAWGSIYSSGDFDPDIIFPQEFTTIKSCNVNYVMISSSAWIGDIKYTETKVNNIQLFRGTTSSSVSCTVDYQALGTWK